MVGPIVVQPLLYQLRQSRQCLINISIDQPDKENYLIETHFSGDSVLCKESILGHMSNELTISSTKGQIPHILPSM